MFFYRADRSYAVLIEVTAKILNLLQGDELIAAWPIAVGKPSTPTPVGQWEIINKKVLPSGSIFGSRWIGLSKAGYGIHGTNNPASIGGEVSLGCVRMHNHNVEELFKQVYIGTPVKIVNQAPASDIYQVKAGDTLWSIAQKNHSTVEKLMMLNPQINPWQLKENYKIKLRKKY